MQRTRQLSLAGANWLYLIILVGLVFIPLILNRIGINTGNTTSQLVYMIIMEIAIVGLPAFFFLWFGSDDRKAAFKSKPLPILDVFLIGGMAVTGYGFIIFVNLVWFAILSLIGEPAAQDIPVITTGQEFLLAVVAMGIVPALCEELLFRGVMLNAYEHRMKWVRAVLMVGVLFAFYHILLMTIPAIIILGVMITFVVYRTRSIWAGVLYHFVHNFLSVCLAYAQGVLVEYLDESGLAGDITSLEGSALVSGIIAWGVIGAVCLALFGVFMWLLHYRTRDMERPVETLEKPSLMDWLPVVFAVVLILILWVFQVIAMAVG